MPQGDEGEDDELYSENDEDNSLIKRFKNFNFGEFINNNKIPISIALTGMILLGLGVFLFTNGEAFKSNKIEVVDNVTPSPEARGELVVEVAGSVVRPGVYKLKDGSRVEDLMTLCGGLSQEADRAWVEKYVNRAAKLTDGQKIYIKSVSETQDQALDKQTSSNSASSDSGYQSGSPVLGVENTTLVNINTASFAELDSLPGIGQVYGQKIVEQRPYSSIEELVNRGVVPKSTYEKIKDKISVN